MIALGAPSWHKGPPILGRSYANPPPRRPSIMAAIKSLIQGLTDGPSGTYIIPHLGGYTFGRWARCAVTGGYRFDRLGERSTVEACKEAFEAFDKATERRVKLLNRRRRG